MGESVPNPFDPWAKISEFALSYNGYELYGEQTGDLTGPNNLADFANATERRWERAGSLPTSLHELRSALFFEQRRSQHLGEFDPWEDWENPRSNAEPWKKYIRSLLEAIGQQSVEGSFSLSDSRVSNEDD